MPRRAKASPEEKDNPRRQRRKRDRSRGFQGLWGLDGEDYEEPSSEAGKKRPCHATQPHHGELAKLDFPSKVPGATASTFFGRAVCQQMLRLLLKGRCRLSGFARSFAALRDAPLMGEETSPSSVFPIPLPYPEVFQSRRTMPAEERARKKWFVW